MKKTILVLLIFMLFVPLSACTKEIPDYSIEEAFELMNEAITGYLESDSLSLEYSGSYESTNYTINEFMRVKMKDMNSDELIGKVEMYVTENGIDFDSVADYEDGIIYTSRTTSEGTDYVKQTLAYAEYQTLYKSFLKQTIAYENTRNQSILVDEDTLTVYFELESGEVESTFFVSNVLQTVNFATVSITLDHDANLLSMNVEYNGSIDSVVGVESYDIAILLLNKYIIIDQLSSTQKALYTEETTS